MSKKSHRPGLQKAIWRAKREAQKEAPKIRRRLARERAAGLEQMRHAYESGHEMAAYDALILTRAAGTPPPRWALDAMITEGERRARGEKPPKKMGRPKRNMLFEAFCYESVNDLLKEGVSWTDALERLAGEFDYDAKTIQRFYASARRKFEEGEPFYYSEIVHYQRLAPGLEAAAPEDFLGGENLVKVRKP